jgi:hypothetical protein
MLAGDLSRADKSRDPGNDRGSPRAPAWRPSGADEAIAAFERIALHCVYSCGAFTDGCIEDGCEAWNLEGAAAGYLAARWFDAQDCSE